MRQFRRRRGLEKLVRVVCYLPAREVEALKRIAKVLNISVSAALRLSITNPQRLLVMRPDLTSTERRSDEGGD